MSVLTVPKKKFTFITGDKVLKVRRERQRWPQVGEKVEHGPHFGKMAPSSEKSFHWRTVMGAIKNEVPNNSKLPDDFDFALK